MIVICSILGIAYIHTMHTAYAYMLCVNNIVHNSPGELYNYKNIIKNSKLSFDIKPNQEFDNAISTAA